MEIDDVEYLIVYANRQTRAQRVTTGDWLGVHYLSAFLNENGVATLSFAGYVHEVPALLADYAVGRSLRMIGFSCDYENQDVVLQLCRLVREKYPLVRLVVGGPQAFALDKEFFVKSEVDAVVCGEGELTTLDLCHYFMDGSGHLANIRGIRYMKEGEVVSTPPRDLIQNLDALPFPNPDYVLGSLFRQRMAAFLTGRGCPYSCAFCYEGGNTKGVRWRSVGNVMAEIEWVLSSRPDLHYLMFTDDTFTIDESRVREFCGRLRELRGRYKFEWFCEGHVRTLLGKGALLQEMVDAGLVCLQIGIESGCNEVLKAYGKHITTSMIETVVRDAYSAGVRELWGNIILGGAFESTVNVNRNLSFCKRLYALAPGMVNVDVVYFWPLPGTRITTHPDDYGMRIVDPGSVGARMDYPVVEYPAITRDEFVRLRHRFVRELSECALRLVPAIPVKRAMDILANANVTRNKTIWFDHLSAFDEYRVFFVLLQGGATMLSSSLSRSELWALHPLRTGSVVEVDDEGRVVAVGEHLPLDESAILKMAAGKLDSRGVYEETRSAFASPEEFLEKLVGLEAKRLLAFSRY